MSELKGRPRLDATLVARGLAESRERAQAVIRAGDVYVAGQREDKPGTRIAPDAAIEVRARSPWVGRGAEKLDAALDAFDLPVAGMVCLDVGASTGGFTQVLLARGARHVYAVDVGRGQLAWALRQDPRVTSLERTDIRALDALPERADLATIDVAFISVRVVLPAVARLVRPSAPVIALIKPQFEAGRARVGRGGVIRDEAVRRAVLSEVVGDIVSAGWRVVDAAPAAIHGTAGNREAFVRLLPPPSALGAGAMDDALDVATAVARAAGPAPA